MAFQIGSPNRGQMKEVKFAISVYDKWNDSAKWLLIFLLKLSKMYWVGKLAQVEQRSVGELEPDYYFHPV